MALIPYRGGWDIGRWFDDEDWPSFKLMRTTAAPKMDIYEKDDKVMIDTELPGFKPEQVSAQIKDNILTIEAKSEEKKEEEDKKKGYWRKETSRGYMSRSVLLPVDVVADKAEAEFEDGMLKISVPKSQPQIEKEKTKKLEIKKK
jgi:HSP20 family protein